MRNLTTEEQRIAAAAKEIAIFEGFEVFEANGYEQVEYSDNNTRCLIDTGYHEEIRWLKPIIRLIKKKGFKATLIGRYCTITGMVDGSKFKSPDKPNSDVESVWIPITEFCKWYNTLTACEKAMYEERKNKVNS